MDLSILVFGTALTLLPLMAAGLLATMVLVERRAERLAAAPVLVQRAHGRPRTRCRKPGRTRRG
jgi:hypothetical protein